MNVFSLLRFSIHFLTTSASEGIYNLVAVPTSESSTPSGVELFGHSFRGLS
jgi:hypothetical protein